MGTYETTHRFVHYMKTMAPGMPEETLRELAFYGGVSDPDDATAVIRGMAHLEAQLLQLVFRNLEHTKPINVNAFSLTQRIKWALALGEIGQKTAKALCGLAPIRNRLAHNHTVVFADNELIKGFVKTVDALPLTVGLEWKMPPDTMVDYDPPMTNLRWQLRMGITMLSQQLAHFTMLPPLRTHVRPTEPTIHVPPTYTPQKPA